MFACLHAGMGRKVQVEVYLDPETLDRLEHVDNVSAFIRDATHAKLDEMEVSA